MEDHEIVRLITQFVMRDIKFYKIIDLGILYLDYIYPESPSFRSSSDTIAEAGKWSR